MIRSFLPGSHRKMCIARGLSLVAMVSTVAGCAQGLDGLVSTHDSDLFLQNAAVHETTQTTALASLPREAGQVLSVRQQRREDGLSQHIVVSGDLLAQGENWIKVDVRTDVPPVNTQHHQVYAEMQSVFGGQALPIYNYVLANEHGPVGLAFGPVSGYGNCAYMWQDVSQADVQATDRRMFARAAGQWSARVRLCRERLTLDHAVAFAEGLSLGAYSDPLFAPLAAAPTDVADQPVTLSDANPASTLASLDAPVPSASGAPVESPAVARTRYTPPNPVARHGTAVAASGAVPIVFPSDRSSPAGPDQLPVQTNAEPISGEVAVAIPLPN